MTFLVFEKLKFSKNFAELQQKLKFSAALVKIHSTKRENVFENLKHISVFTWVTTKTQKFEFM